MEYRVGGNEVLLTLDRAYVADDDTALLQQVSRFKPLVDYLTTFKPQNVTVSTLTITNVQQIAGRVAAVRGMLTVKHKETKDTITQPLVLADEAPSVVLPVITVGQKHYAVLVRRPRLPVGGAEVTEAFEGTFRKEDGAFVAEGAELLKALGLQVTDKTCSALSNDDVTLGNEGSAPVKLLRASKIFTEQSFADATQTAIVSEDGSASLVVVPMEEVSTASSDLKAIVAASVFMRSKQQAAAPAASQPAAADEQQAQQ